MKKRVVLTLILAAVLSLYAYSSARKKVVLPRPEDKAGRVSSSFVPEEVEGKPAAKGSDELKLTGPVWVSE